MKRRYRERYGGDLGYETLGFSPLWEKENRISVKTVDMHFSSCLEKNIALNLYFFKSEHTK